MYAKNADEVLNLNLERKVYGKRALDYTTRLQCINILYFHKSDIPKDTWWKVRNWKFCCQGDGGRGFLVG